MIIVMIVVSFGQKQSGSYNNKQAPILRRIIIHEECL